MIDEHEQLVRLFGLDQPVLTETEGQWSARFDRQLTCPADVAWGLFLGGAPAPAKGEQFRPAGAPEVVLGTVTEVQDARLLAFDTAPDEPGDHIRVELEPGSGHGARLVLTVSGSDPSGRDAAIDQWGAGAVEHVAQEAAAWARSAEREGASTT